MFKIVKPPKKFDPDRYSAPGVHTVFLAGSIDMGKATDWQAEVTEALRDARWKKTWSFYVFNPRRDQTNWDAKAAMDLKNRKFVNQVVWEQDHIDIAHTVFFYFEAKGKAPISLMELGLVCARMKGTFPPNVVVVCPKTFWRSGNVHIMCKRYGIPVFETLDEGIAELQELF